MKHHGDARANMERRQALLLGHTTDFTNRKKLPLKTHGNVRAEMECGRALLLGKHTRF